MSLMLEGGWTGSAAVMRRGQMVGAVGVLGRVRCGRREGAVNESIIAIERDEK